MERATPAARAAHDGASGRSRRASRAISCIALLLCAYLISPAFHAVHLEGFTAQTESIALLGSVAPNVAHDPYLPVVSQFIYQTRSGVVDILKMIYKAFPESGDFAFRGLVLASFVAWITAAIFFARRWAGISPLFAFFALMATPGIPETGFFFNDNIVSAAFATTALALVSTRARGIAWLLSGMCLGVAVLARIDAIFVLPLIFGTIFCSHPRRRDQVIGCALIGFSALAVLTGSAVFHGFSVIDAYVTAQKFVFLADDPARWFWVRILFFGLMALPLLVCGAWLNFGRLRERKSSIGIATFIVYPLLLAIFAPKVTELRYILPLLAPVVAMHGGVGLRWVYEQCSTGAAAPRRYAWGVVILSLVVLLFPTTMVRISDGPRSVLGRLWSPPRWATWQGSMEESMRRTRQLVTSLDDGRLNIVLTTHYNDEFFLRLRLIEAGFLPALASSKYPACNGFSLFTKGGSTVAHIRTHPQYRMVPLTAADNAALQITSAFACPALETAGRTFVTAFGDSDDNFPPEVYSFSAASLPGTAFVEFADMRDLVSRKDLSVYRRSGLLRYRQLTPEELQATRARARQYLANAAAGRGLPAGKTMTIEDYLRVYGPLPGPTSLLLSRLKSANEAGDRSDGRLPVP